jgi:small subunit ribosomal protein S9
LQQEGKGEVVAQLLKEYARPSNNAAATSLLSEEQAAEVAAAQASNVGGRENNRGYGYLSRDSGISYAIGRKKTASARAWILPLPETSTPVVRSTEGAEADGAQAKANSTSDEEPALGQILINSRPISRYFPAAAERSVILRPFTLTENLGKYNVFVLVAGSGTSSQAQAVAVACARALAARDLSDENVTRQILSKGKLFTHMHCGQFPVYYVSTRMYSFLLADMLRRDPRVVERKKTGKPKARKSYTWVKR